MSYSIVQYPISSTTTGPFTVTFPYLFQYQVEVRKNGTLLPNDGSAYTWPTGSTVQLVASAVNGDVIDIRRNSLKKADGSTGRIVTFNNSAKLGSNDLNNDGNQEFYLAQEAFDAAANALQFVSDNTFDATTHRIKNVVDPLNPQDAATKNYVDLMRLGTWPSPLGIGSGGTGAATAAAARANLGSTPVGDLAFTSASALSTSLVDLLHIDAQTGHRDMIRAGWVPAFFNPQWGGAPHYFEMEDAAGTGKFKFEASTGYIEDSGTATAISDVAATTADSQGFKVSKSDSYPAVWVKVYKVGNLANNLELRIQADDGSGVKPTANFTAIANGTATAQIGRVHTSDANGQWVRFVFPTPCALTAGTQYHITLKSSGDVDAANFWGWKRGTANKYPHGASCNGTGAPVWSATASVAFMFMVEAPATTASLQTGGVFSDGKLQFFEGAPLNQSNARVKDLKDFQGLDLTDFTLALAGNTWTKDRTILDITYGLDHDRIVLRCNVTTGFAQLDVYDSAGNRKTVTGGTDISAGTSLLGIRVRARGDGADKVELWENGVKNVNSLSAQTIAFDTLFGLSKIGTFWIGGGWQVAPAWSGSSISSFTGLPSTLGWTYSGTATEANHYYASGGKLYQPSAAYGSTDTGIYLKSAPGFVAANGGSLVTRLRVAYTTNTKIVGVSSGPVSLAFWNNGTRSYGFSSSEYFGQASDNAAAWTSLPQFDAKSYENCVHLIGKGNDQMVFVNGRLLVDGTAQNVSAINQDQILFGDNSPTAGENADVVYSYMKYSTAAALLPQFTTGSLSEIAIWKGDRTSLLATMWNAGSPISAKQLCGAEKNFKGDIWVQRVVQRGITAGPTTTSAAPSVQPEMESFVIGSEISLNLLAEDYCPDSSVSQGQTNTLTLDGAIVSTMTFSTVSAGVALNISNMSLSKTFFGLHKAERRWAFGGTGTLQSAGTSRVLRIEARP